MEISRAELPPELQHTAAQVAYNYFCANIVQFDTLDTSTKTALRSHLTHAENSELTRLRPPAVPSPVPGELSAVLRWFTQEYLPYRHWQSEYGDTSAATLISQLATDHRSHPVPSGMESHGRTAYGASDKTPTREGYIIGEGRATLFRSRFDLLCDVTVPLDGDAFEMNNEATGSEEFAHGGLYPEETIVPWVEIVRDRRKPKVRVVLKGKGRTGQSGILEISVENSSTIPVTLQTLTLRPGNQAPLTLNLNITLRGQTRYDGEITIDRWFRKTDAEQATSTAEFVQDDGSMFENEPEIALTSTEMYQRENLLDDLLEDF